MFPQPPIAGKWVVTILEMNPYSIHGDPYFQLAVLLHEPLGPPTPIGLRVSAHVLGEGVALRQKAEITFLMGQVTAIQPVSEFA